MEGSFPLKFYSNTLDDVLYHRDGHYGLYFDASLIEGTTHRCPTFNNDSLAQGEQKGQMISFDCAGLEVWGVGP